MDERAVREAHHDSIHESLAQEKDAHDVQHGALKGRIDVLESVMSSAADKHARELETVRVAHEMLAVEARSCNAHHASMAERLETLEQAFGESADAHAKYAQAT